MHGVTSDTCSGTSLKCICGNYLKTSDVNRDTVHRNGRLHCLSIGRRAREGRRRGEGGVREGMSCLLKQHSVTGERSRAVGEGDKMLKCKIVMFSTMKMEPL